jgi:alpha/beta hydrolase family protein
MRCITRTRAAGVVGAAVLVLALASCSVLTGPITSPGTIGLATGVDVSTLGYRRSEFFLTGVAHSYTPTAPLTADGKWTVTPAPTTSGFRTRIVAYRPIDPSKFNGTVVVEWLNVSAGVDLANDWVMAHNEFVRSGAAYVGVSAQAVGVNQLKASQPARYGSLNHPGDSYSYDIFTEAALKIRANANVMLDGLEPKRIIATGESQSAFRLVTYIDAVQPLVHAYDGFMVHSRFASGSALTQAPLPSVVPPSPLAIRDDLKVPVMVVEAEGDVIGSNLGARQPDTARFREWEIAGTSHADSYTISVGFGDVGDGKGATQMFAFMRAPQNTGCTSPVNAGPHHWILDTAFHDLDAWVRTGVAPPMGTPLQVVSTSPVVLARDAQGNALGGVRTPQVDAPVATLTGINSGSGFCSLFGSTTPFTTARLTALYPTHADFVAKWKAALDSAVTKGFILPADQPELLAAATSSTVPN